MMVRDVYHEARFLMVGVGLIVLGSMSPAAASPRLLERPDHTPGPDHAVEPRIDDLESSPLEIRKTADHHLALARDWLDRGDPRRAGIALATGRLVDSGSARRVPDPVARLALQGRSALREALAARASGDGARAIQKYVDALLADGSLVAEDDHGLRSVALGTLESVARRHPQHPWHRFQLGLLAYLSGDLELSSRALHPHAEFVSDPYARWRTEQWLARIDAELASEREAHRKAIDRIEQDPGAGASRTRGDR